MGNVYRSSFCNGPDGQATMPFLKWAGGKQWLAGRISALVPQSGTYYEPFLGGGSLFLAARPQRAHLGDINARLIETYRAIRKNPMLVMRHLNSWPNEKAVYYQVRNSTSRSMYKRAARFIYLNRTCWNGLYRVNKSGIFNVPYGDSAERKIYEKDNLLRVSRFLSSATLVAGDFEETTAEAGPGDFVYFDPPYATTSSENSFRRYNNKVFSWSDQVRLAEVAKKLAATRCNVLISNANHADVARLYNRFHHYELARQSSIAGDPRFRKIKKESLFSSFPISRPKLALEVQLRLLDPDN